MFLVIAGISILTTSCPCLSEALREIPGPTYGLPSAEILPKNEFNSIKRIDKQPRDLIERERHEPCIDLAQFTLLRQAVDGARSF